MCCHTRMPPSQVPGVELRLHITKGAAGAVPGLTPEALAGRPKYADILAACEQQEGKVGRGVAVLACGPEPMVNGVQVLQARLAYVATTLAQHWLHVLFVLELHVLLFSKCT